MQEYVVSYATGAGGTWISWLINQHNNFPKIRLEEDNQFYDKVSDDTIGTFHFGIAARRPLYNKDASNAFFQTFIQNNPEAVQNFSKYSYKPSPHAPASIIEYLDNTEDHIFNGSTTLLIVGMFSNVDVFLKRNSYINDMFNLYHNTGIEYIEHNNQKCYELDVLCNSLGIASKVIDAGKLLFDDRTEYSKLCSIIDEQPLAEYQTHVNFAIDTVWKKFM